MTRRDFLGRTSLLAVGGCGGLLSKNAPALFAADSEPKPAKPRLSVCIDAIFTKLPFEERLAAVKTTGVTAFEFWGWRNRDLEGLAKKKEELGLHLAAFSCDTGGALVAPGSKDRFMRPLKESIAAAQKLGSKRLIVTVGNELKELPRSEQHNNIVESFRVAAPVCEDAGIILCIEPLNVLVNHKGYYLATSAEAFQIIDEVGSPNVRLLFDIYHQQITEGNLIQNITRNIGKIAHFHVADVPGRHQPGTGEINYRNVFQRIAQAGYDGFAGLEMWPTNDSVKAVQETAELFNEAIGM